jgi:hypothetical protein
MPAQEVFFDRTIGDQRFQILKTYDTAFAREAFAEMNPAALDHLATSLAVESGLDIEGAPGSSQEYVDILWDRLVESAREDGQKCSFFVVSRSSKTRRSFLYVSGDWPSAEGFVRRLFPA